MTIDPYRALLLAFLTASSLALADGPGHDAVAKAVASKDHQAAMARIASENKADIIQCGRRSGPAAKACALQADAKRQVAEGEAQGMLERAANLPPASSQEQQDAAGRAARSAKVKHGVAKARIASQHNAALVECGKLKGAERSTCRKDVASRTADARDRAAAAHTRAVRKAQYIVER